MSRDREYPPERERSRQASGGQELPRGGRAGTKTRPRPSGPRDVRDVLVQQLDLPRSDERERVWVADRTYDLRASEVRALATIGAFRVVDAADLQARGDRWHDDLDRLRETRLIEFTSKVL